MQTLNQLKPKIQILVILLLFIGCDQKDNKVNEKNFDSVVKEQEKKTLEKRTLDDSIKTEEKIKIKEEEPKNINRDIKSILGKEDLYKVIVKNAQINNTGNISIELNFNKEEWAITKNLMDEYLSVNSGEYSIALFTLNTVFKYSNSIFKKFPESESITYNFVNPSEIRDKYGNITGHSNDNIAIMKLSRSTASKINWKYANEKLGQIVIGGDYKELLLMLDETKFN